MTWDWYIDMTCGTAVLLGSVLEFMRYRRKGKVSSLYLGLAGVALGGLLLTLAGLKVAG